MALLRRRRPAAPPSIDALLAAAPAEGNTAERHLWLIEVLRWVRRGEPVSGMQYVARYVEAHEATRARVVALLAACIDDLHLSSLLADHGFAPRAAFLSELGARVRAKALPASPDTRDLSELFGLLFRVERDPAWLAEIDEGTLDRLGELFIAAWDATGRQALRWRGPFMEALSILASQVRAAGVSPELRLRMGDSEDVRQSFGRLARATEDLHDLLDDGGGGLPPPPGAVGRTEEERHAAVLQQAQYLRGLLDHCARLAQGVMAHLEAYGVSVDVVFQIDELTARCRRMELLLDCLLSAQPGHEIRLLVLSLIEASARRRSLRALFRQHYSLLARLVAERSAETGEHYITRTRAAYFDMLGRASGGGAVMAFTTFIKFFLTALGLSAFWAGFAAGTNYAISFVVIYLLGWRVATKQPAMTAPAMAAKLGDTHTDEGVADFVDEAANLIRSQVAGIIGNLALVFPMVLALQGLAWWAFGRPLIDGKQAEYALHSLTLLGPSLLFAAFTGTLLFASSLIAGWVENWFVWHRLDSALQWHPRTRRWLGAARAERWARWWRANISGLTANVSLGFMLGLTPAIAGFFGLPIEVRHVTLSTGQLAAALGTLGLPALYRPEFWWCLAAIPLTGLLNVAVSFALALRVALRSRGVRVKDRSRLWKAMRRRFWRHPLSFVLPPSRASEAAALAAAVAAETAPAVPDGKDQVRSV